MTLTREQAETLAVELNPGGTIRAQVGRLFEAARGTESLRELADRVGLAHGTLHQFEQGRDNPTLERLDRMARLYGKTLRITLE